MAEPPITLRAIHDSGPMTMPVTRIVIHATCPSVGYPAASAPGAAVGTARYFQQASSGGSAHYVEDPTTETHCVPDNVIAWHAPPNEHSIGIEICAEGGQYSMSYSRDQWLSPQVWPAVQRAAARTRELCDRFGVPQVKIGPGELVAGAHGICGHVDVSQAWNQSTHSDPGPAFPWPEFMAEVTNPQGADMPLSDDDLRKLHDAVWFGASGATLIPNEFSGGGEWAKTTLGSMEARIGREIVAPAVAALEKKIEAGTTAPVNVDASQVAAALSTNGQFLQALAKAVNDDAAKRLAS